MQPGLQPGAQGCRAEQVPAVAQGLCAGAGTLPPARLSTQRARGAAQGAAGRRVGGRSSRQGRAGQGRAGQGRGLLLTELLPGAGGSQLRCTKGHSQGFCKGGNKAGIFHVLFVGKGEGWSCKLWTHP